MERRRTVIEVQLVAARRAYSYQFAQSHLARSSNITTIVIRHYRAVEAPTKLTTAGTAKIYP